MQGLLVVFAITFCAVLGFWWLINTCRRRLRKTRHGLTGMCHDTGGAICPSCRDHTACTPPAKPPALPPE